MGIQVLSEFQLKMTLIIEAIAKKVILPKILPIFGYFCPKFYPIYAKFERISNFSEFNHRNTSTDRVSTQNDPNW